MVLSAKDAGRDACIDPNTNTFNPWLRIADSTFDDYFLQLDSNDHTCHDKGDMITRKTK